MVKDGEFQISNQEAERLQCLQEVVPNSSESLEVSGTENRSSSLAPEDSTPSDVPKNVSDCRKVIRKAFTAKGLSVQAAEIMLSSLTESTIKQYANPIKRWWQFCFKKEYNPYDISESKLLEFLSKRFEEGASYGTLNSSRSAISLLSNTNLSDSTLLTRFFKGVYKQRPLRPRYNKTWDPKIVLNYLENLGPIKDLKLSELTKKLVALLALGTGHRLQTLAVIKLVDIKKTKNGLEVEIRELIKTSKKGVDQPLLCLPKFEKKPKLCIATHVEEYIKRTSSIRGNCNNLLVTWSKPHKEASSQTISRWIKSVLSASGVGEEFTAYSTRHASTSSAFRKGVDINVIKSTAGWSKSSEVFAKFYNRPLKQSKNNFAESVILEA
ncbi:uncharacterized protein LOC141529804 [Cotesia typhae]|uniref:uncharacterized protein LOC141529804 n=1 Tax=Cotesia typhae TaxID=2053667 RepID=UPI003D69167B